MILVDFICEFCPFFFSSKILLTKFIICWCWHSFQVCGASREQRKINGPKEEGEIQNHESESERDDGLRT